MSPVAWIYELATGRNEATGEPEGWSSPRVSLAKPIGDPSVIRNLRPLYEQRPAPARGGKA